MRTCIYFCDLVSFDKQFSIRWHYLNAFFMQFSQRTIDCMLIFVFCLRRRQWTRTIWSRVQMYIQTRTWTMLYNQLLVHAFSHDWNFKSTIYTIDNHHFLTANAALTCNLSPAPIIFFVYLRFNSFRLCNLTVAMKNLLQF